MKAGLTIEELATEIMRQRDAKADYIVDTSKLCMENYGTDLVLRILGDDNIDRIEPLDIAETAHRQIGTRLGIPAKYYGKMLSEHPDLLVTNVNAWFGREPTERMLRVLDGKVRAYLSNSYMRIHYAHIMASLDFVVDGNDFSSVTPPMILCVVVCGLDFQNRCFAVWQSDKVIYIRQHIGIDRVIKHLLDLINLKACFHMENLGHQILKQMPDLFRHPIAFAVLIRYDFQFVVVEISGSCKGRHT